MHIAVIEADETQLQERITQLREVFLNGKLCGMTDPHKAEQWSLKLAEEGETLDYVFTDTHLHGSSGFILAARIKKQHPSVHLFFCTSHTEYAYDAFCLHAKGYFLKPVSTDNIIAALNAMIPGWNREISKEKREIKVTAFGHFEIFVNGKKLSFAREKAKELLAYLVDRHGASVTTEQIAAVLWEDRPYDRTLKNYVSTIVSTLRNTLRKADAEDILIKTRNHLSLDTTKIVCDAYGFEQGIPEAKNAFYGEYMVNYSWAEFRTGIYIQMEQGRRETDGAGH